MKIVDLRPIPVEMEGKVVYFDPRNDIGLRHKPDNDGTNKVVFELEWYTLTYHPQTNHWTGERNGTPLPHSEAN